jgi:type VI secretion system secreted protein VgrG
VNGAQACNVFWQVGSSATFGTTTEFAGTVIATASITATTGAVINGRLLALNAAVTLDSNTITVPTCD